MTAERDDHAPERAALADAWLETMLEERTRHASPPDLAGQVMAAAATSPGRADPRRSWLPLAAAVVLGALAVAWAMSGSGRGDAPAPAQDGELQDKKPYSNLVEPGSLAALRRLAPKFAAVEVHPETVGDGVEATVRGELAPDPVVISGDGELRAIRAALDGLQRVPGADPWPVDQRFRLKLDQHRYVEVSTTGGTEPDELRIRGVDGTFSVSRGLRDALAGGVRAARAQAIVRQGILVGADLDAATPPAFLAQLSRMRPHGLTAQHAARLGAWVDAGRLAGVKEVDLRHAPALCDAAGLKRMGGLGRLERVFVPRVDRGILDALAKFPALRELVVLAPGECYWDRSLRPAAKNVDAGLVPGLLGLPKMWRLVLPGAALDDLGVALLSGLKELDTLVLTGARNITGEGFGVFGESGHTALRNLYLHSCPALTDEGLGSGIAGIPRLAELYLHGTRSQRFTVQALATLAASKPPLERLEIGAFFGKDLPLDDAARAALAAVARIPTLSVLYLDDCPGLTAADLLVLKGATNLEMICLSNHGLGAGFEKAVEPIWHDGLTFITN